MTHPTGSLPIPFDDNNHDDDHDLESFHDTHESANISTEPNSLSSLGKEIVDDYRIVPQDAPLEQNSAIYTSGDLYSFLATSQETNFNFNAFDFFVPEGGGPPPSGIDPKQLEFGQRTGGGIAFSGYELPQGTPNYILVLPEKTSEELENNIRNQVAGIEGFSVFTNSERPTFTGAFGIEYTSLSNLAETEDDLGTKLSYDQFSLAPQSTNPIIEDDLNGSQISEDFPDPIVSEDYKAFYVREGTLSFKINDEVKTAEPDTFVYVAPGNEYSIANFGTEPVESLAMTIPVQPEPERTILSPLESQADTVYQSVFLGDEADIFSPPDERDRIGISGLPGVSSFEDLKLLPSFGDIRSTSIVAEVEGVEKEISLGNVVDVYFNELSADDFVFS